MVLVPRTRRPVPRFFVTENRLQREGHDVQRRAATCTFLITPPRMTTDAPREAVWTEQLGGKLLHSETLRYTTGLLRGTLTARLYRIPQGPALARAC